MAKKSTKARILLAEDDPNLSMVLQDYLEMLDYEIKLAPDGEEGLKLFRNFQFDMCILDVMMPVKDGFTLAREIREEDKDVPIIFLTAKSLKEDRIKGFKEGADDYITKPFSTEELSLRIEAVLKRFEYQKLGMEKGDVTQFKIGTFDFDSANMILKQNSGKEKNLTRKEAALLKLLCANQNQLVTREFALKSIWGENDYFIGRSMDVFITKLRKYLKDDSNISITNVHGAGFKLEVKDQ